MRGSDAVNILHQVLATALRKVALSYWVRHPFAAGVPEVCSRFSIATDEYFAARLQSSFARTRHIGRLGVFFLIKR
jgi:hypothetical protein